MCVPSQQRHWRQSCSPSRAHDRPMGLFAHIFKAPISCSLFLVSCAHGPETILPAMVNAFFALISAILPFVQASAIPASRASTWAGVSQSAVWPPPNATNTATSAFPNESEVGYAGPTPTGAEPAAIVTAPAFAKLEGAYPLIVPADLETSKFDIYTTWGNLAPAQSLDSGAFGLPESSLLIPSGCELNQVHLLHRHGHRYPTTGSGPSQFAAAVNAAANSATGFNATGPLSFLNTWTYKLGAEILTPFGRKEVFDLGVAHRTRYGYLLNEFKEIPVFRTTSEDRMVASALNFAAGFFDVSTFTEDYHQVIIIEADGFNNTLAPYDTCTNSNVDSIGYYGDSFVSKWESIYLADAVKRLQPHAQGLNLTTGLLADMQSLCAYETAAIGYSAFCDVFTKEEWENFAYTFDLEFWYNEGPGNPTSAAQGLGWVQELLARLTKSYITEWNSTTNSTLDNNPTTFPLEQPIFVDATHDVVISNIVTALNFTFLAANGPLPATHKPKNQTYHVNQIAPMASTLVAQVLSCPASDTPTHIRFALNDAVVPLTGLKGCKWDKDGLCEFDSFISSIKERIGEIDYKFDCLANYTVPNPDDITDGRYPVWLRNSS